jgi:hypothetical protein
MKQLLKINTIKKNVVFIKISDISIISLLKEDTDIVRVAYQDSSSFLFDISKEERARLELELSRF